MKFQHYYPAYGIVVISKLEFRKLEKAKGQLNV